MESTPNGEILRENPLELSGGKFAITVMGGTHIVHERFNNSPEYSDVSSQRWRFHGELTLNYYSGDGIVDELVLLLHSGNYQFGDKRLPSSLNGLFSDPQAQLLPHIGSADYADFVGLMLYEEYVNATNKQLGESFGHISLLSDGTPVLSVDAFYKSLCENLAADGYAPDKDGQTRLPVERAS